MGCHTPAIPETCPPGEGVLPGCCVMPYPWRAAPECAVPVVAAGATAVAMRLQARREVVLPLRAFGGIGLHDHVMTCQLTVTRSPSTSAST